MVLAYQPGSEIVSALFACAKVGLIAIPTPPLTGFDHRAWLNRLDHVLADSGAAAWLTCGHTLELFHQARHRKLAPEARATVEHLLTLPAIETTAIAIDPQAKAPDRPHAIAFLQYTSGSTSQPKGVCVSHTNLLANCAAVVDHDNPVAVTWLPQHHDMGLIGYYINAALAGGTTYGMAPGSFVRNPALWLALIARHRATVTSVPNFALELCLDERRVSETDRARVDLSSLRWLMVAAEQVLPASFDAFLRRFAPAGLRREALFVAYGLAEFTLAVSSYGRSALSVDRRALAKGEVQPVTDTGAVAHALPLMSCGRALGGADIRIVDPETGTEVGSGRSGEIWVAGASRAMGYWRKPTASRDTFEARLAGDQDDSPRYLRTGDIGFLREGELYVCGRLKDMMIVHGQNIYPEGIEAAVRRAAPELRRTGVVAFASGEDSDSDITVVAELARGRAMPEVTEIVRAIREGLQVPVARVVFVLPRSVPRTSSGKPQRARTRALLDAGRLQVLADSRHAFAGSTGAGEDEEIYELAQLRSRYGITGEETCTLFDVGIDSLDLVVVMHWIREALTERNAADLARRINPQLLAALPIRELFAIARSFVRDPESATQMMAAFFHEAYAERLASERARMLADRTYVASDRRRPGAVSAPIGTFVTGGTGFLGPHLIDALLRQTPDRLHVLVRGRSHDEARNRLNRAFAESITDPARRAAFAERVEVVPGDLEEPRLGLDEVTWSRLAEGVTRVWHNGALVNYLLAYEQTRAANVAGTAAVLDLCFTGRNKQLNHVSTTFIFGWTGPDSLSEADRNDAMEGLDFGYSQSKWVSEQQVHAAIDQGLEARVFRPALVTPALGGGGGGNLDIALRLLCFMMRHGIGPSAGNQISLVPADIVADNMVAIAGLPDTLGGSFHVVRDALETMPMITAEIGARTGQTFEMFDQPTFVHEVVRRCTRADPLFPLLDFLVDAEAQIAAMESKRYDSSAYRLARDRAAGGRADPPLGEVIDAILRFLKSRNLP